IGTVEFLMDSNHKFYFLEMNTRIQVEHTITEEVIGIDLVKMQIMLTLGEHLKIKQNEMVISSVSIEVRINAEDPTNHFHPQVGKIKNIIFPMGNGIRNDFGYISGNNITQYYDSLIGKIIVYEKTRSQAIQKMNRALSEFNIIGIKTNIEFLEELIQQKSFKTGQYKTTYIDNIFLKNFHEKTL
ncbi:acetyl-CoA carboxylase biotin carboxylase subunit, partial [Lactobacillus sp. XV13L]|nr:acetyl-CoA carboxylase biotin carboxylase subunit [Lactobacillus sp. XV13L]